MNTDKNDTEENYQDSSSMYMFWMSGLSFSYLPFLTSILGERYRKKNIDATRTRTLIVNDSARMIDITRTMMIANSRS